MRKWILAFAAWFIQLILKLRYKVTVKGLDEIQALLENHPDGILFLPNHPGYVFDPLISISPILKTGVRPMVTEGMYFSPLFYSILRKIRALPVPNLSSSVNPIKLQRLKNILEEVSHGLKRGEAFLIYPAGTTKVTGKEIIGGAYATHQLLQENPKATVVLIRLTGLWGSRFSRAQWQGKTVPLVEAFKSSIKDVLKNLIFFSPKRPLLLEFEPAPQNFPRTSDKFTLNRWLEEWYNKPFAKEPSGGEPLQLISYSAWREELPIIKAAVEEADVFVSQEIQDDIIQLLSELSKVPKKDISAKLGLVENLGLDSLNIAEILTYLETKYGVENIQPEELTTVSRLFAIAAHSYKKEEFKEPAWKLTGWYKPRSPKRVFLSEGKTIPEIFFNTAGDLNGLIACADARSGALTFRKVKRAVLLLASIIEKMPGERIGLLLPASSITQILILACHVAGKTPVMINWTVGGRHLDSVVKSAKIEKVLTSWAFLDNLENVDISAIAPIMAVLEELKVQLPISELLLSKVYSYLPTQLLMKTKKLQHVRELRPEKEAVILFTSGTENLPKGVPLTHFNILSNIRSALQAIEMLSTDKLLAFLPPFHSFGFTITGLMPLLCGIRTAFSPNPLNAKQLSQIMEQCGITLLCGTPTFLKNILRHTPPSALTTLRLMVSGAEKAPDSLFSTMAASCPHAQLIEGYGITECSPVLTANTTNERKNGVGTPLPGVRLRIVHPENPKVCKQVGQEGLILASGPNIFPGYLPCSSGLLTSNPFIEIDGIRWYNTGDIGFLNNEGALTISGRLKRFVKIGGEMVSLAAIEQALLEDTQEDVSAQVAVIAKEGSDGRPALILCTTQPADLFDINSRLRKKGFSNLVKLDKLLTLDELPVTGTGKIAYRELETMLSKQL